MRSIYNLAQNTGDGFLVVWLAALLAGILLTLIAGAWLLHRGRARMHHAFFAVVLLLGLLWSFVMPPLSAPDEVAHYISAYRLSSQILGAPVQNEKHQILIRAQDVFIDDLPDDGDPDNATVVGAKLDLSTYRELHTRGLFGTGEEGTAASQQIPVSTTPFAYLPQALGFALARVLGLGGFGLLYMGRLMNLLLFAALGACAVKRMPIGKEILFGTALFPMTMELVSSLSYDTFILALAFYLTALCMDLCARAGTVKGGTGKAAASVIRPLDILQLAVLAALLAPCKMVYTVLFGMCFLIPVSRWKNKGWYAASIVFVGAMMAGAVLLCNLEQLLLYTGVSQTANEVSWAGAGVESYSLAECLRQPALLSSLLFTTLRLKGGEFLWGMAGRWMGNLDPALVIPVRTAAVFWAILLFLSLRRHGERRILSDGKRLWLLLLAFLLTAAICISMLAAYTPKGEIYIRGIQGRYFLAGLPMLLLTLRSGRISVPDTLLVPLPFCRQRSIGTEVSVNTSASGTGAVRNVSFTSRTRNVQKNGNRMAKISISTAALWLMLLLNALTLHRLYITVCFRLQ